MTNINLSEEQENAIDLCADLKQRIVCVTGQAGTGKTTILKYAFERILAELCERFKIPFPDNGINKDWFDGKPFSIGLAAPTGRAAKRIEEATGLPASTIHRMLRFSVPEDDKDFGLPAHTKGSPMPHNVIFIDEASMLTEDIRRNLIDAMKPGAVIRFFGDINQLPPVIDQQKTKVTIVSPFAQDLRKFPTIQLSKNFRSTDGIIELADRIIKNKMAMNNSQVTVQRIISTSTMDTIIALAEKYDFTNSENQIICPTNSTAYGTAAINRIIQQRFNLEKEKISVWRMVDGERMVRSFKRGDKILWTKNDYNLGLMNGTLGRVLSFDEDSGSIFINADGRDMEIPSIVETFNPTTGVRSTYDPRSLMDLGYAISTHKSQGSQFDFVLFVCSFSRAAIRQNVYTAVTRAKTKLHILNVAGALSKAIENAVDVYATG